MACPVRKFSIVISDLRAMLSQRRTQRVVLDTLMARLKERNVGTGLHAWDHHAWQARIDFMDAELIDQQLAQGVHELTEICGRPPTCSAAPGWKANATVLQQKERFDFRYNSDCRGGSMFIPEVDGHRLTQPQIPVSLPTYDEIIGRDGVSNANFNAFLFSLMKRNQLNLLTIHAEVEGIVCHEMFNDFLEQAAGRGIAVVPAGDLLVDSLTYTVDRIVPRRPAGREGWVACQESQRACG